MAVAGSPHPGKGMGCSFRMTVFTPICQPSDVKIKAGVAARTTVKGSCVTFLTVCQISFGLWPMQFRICKWNGVRRSRTIRVAPRQNIVGIRKLSAVATGSNWIGGWTALCKIVTDAAGDALPAGIAVTRQVVKGIIRASLPSYGMGTCIRVASSCRTSRRINAAVESYGPGFTMAFLAIVKICLGCRPVVNRIRIR